jgi:3',5'-cyclic AMP phosphodiesterase CpdA
MAPLWSCVHLSDTHLVAEGEVWAGIADTGPYLEAAVGVIARLDPPPNLVVISGDLADHGTAEEYRRLAHLLTPLRSPVRVIPGNHDDRHHLRAVLRGTVPDLDGPRSPAGGAPTVDWVDASGPVTVIGLDTLIPGAAGGTLTADQLRWLDDQLAVKPAQPTIIVCHHPSFPTGIAHMDAMRLDADAAAALAGIVGRHAQVERVVSGHVHRPISRRWAGTIAATVPSAAVAIQLGLAEGARPGWIAEPPALAIYIWRPDLGLVAHQLTIGAFATGWFD